MDETLEWGSPETAATAVETIDPFASTAAPVTLPEDVARKRAVKAQLAFSGDEAAPSLDEIYNSIHNAREDVLRKRLAATEDLRKQQMRSQMVVESVNSGTADPELVAGLATEQPTNPDTVLEKKYAEVRQDLGLSSWDDFLPAREKAPEKIDEAADKSLVRITQNEILATTEARVKAKYEQTGIMRTIGDFAFSVIPFASMTEQRNITPDNVDLGDSLTPAGRARAQVRSLRSMNPDEFQSTIAQMEKEADESGDYAPLLEFLSKVREYGIYEASIENAFGVLDAAEVLPGGLIFDAVKGGIRGGSAIASMAGEASLRKAATEAVQGGGKASATTPAATPAKAAGDSPSPVSGAPEMEVLEASIYGRPVKSSEATPGEIAAVEKILAEETKRVGKSTREADNELKNYLTAWLGQAKSPKAATESPKFYTPDERQEIIDSWSEAVRVNGETFTAKPLTPELEDKYPGWDNGSLHYIATIHAIEKYGEKAVDEALLLDGATGYLDKKSGKYLSNDELWRTREEATVEAAFNAVEAQKAGPETVKTAAIRVDGKVYEAPNHFEALQVAAEQTGKTEEQILQFADETTDGFVTSTGRFVSREEADTIAKGAGQKKADSNNANFLGSEDLVPAAPKVGTVTSSYPAPLSVEEVAKLPFVQQNIEDAYRTAHNLGVVSDIERLAAQGKTASEIKVELGSRLDRVGEIAKLNGSSPEGEKNNLIRFVRGKLGIPSLEERAEFAAWQNSYNNRAMDAATVTVDIPNPRTGEVTQANVPATDEILARVHLDAVEKATLSDDLTDILIAHGDETEAALNEIRERYVTEAVTGLKTTVEQQSKALAKRLPSILDPLSFFTGRGNRLKKQALNLANKYDSVLRTQGGIREALIRALGDSETMGALRIGDEAFEKIKAAAQKQMDKLLKTPSSAIRDLKVSFKREWETGLGRTNQVIYEMGKPDGTLFTSPGQAHQWAKDVYGLPEKYYNVIPIHGGGHQIQIAKVIDESDPDVLSMTITRETSTPMSWSGVWAAYLRGSAGVSSEFLQQNLAVSTHHAKALHEAFQKAADDIGKLTKKDVRKLDILLEAKRDVVKEVTNPYTGQKEKVRGEWFNTARELEETWKKAYGEYPSDKIVSAYATFRQMYDFDYLLRNADLYRQKSIRGWEKVYLDVPQTHADTGDIHWVRENRALEVKVVDEVPEGDHYVLHLDNESLAANYFNTGKSGREGLKALQEKGYKVFQLTAPDQRPLKHINDNYIQFVVAKDFERAPLTLEQISATEGGHVRIREPFFIKQAKFETTSNAQRLYSGDTTLLGAGSEAEAKKHASALETARQLLKARDMKALADHLKKNTAWSLPEFEKLFAKSVDDLGNEVPPTLDIDTPIGWVADGQGMNDAAKSHMPELRSSFNGILDTIDDPFNEMRLIGKRYTGEKDLVLSRMVTDPTGKKAFAFDKARHISPLETLEQAWAELSRNQATDNMKIQAMRNWVEEAAPYLETPIEELRQDPWAHMMNPRWNRQYGDLANQNTLDAQRRQIISFLGQKGELQGTIDWMKNKLLNSIYNKGGNKAVDWVDDHLLGLELNPFRFMRSFAFHTKLGLFNPVQIFLQTQSMLHTWAVTGNPKRVGSALSGVTLMQAARVNRNPQILAALGKKAEAMGWKAGEWEEMEGLYRKLSLHIVEGEVGVLDVMSSPRMFQGKLGNFLDKGLIFFREAERVVRMNAWAVAYKEYRDKFPTKVLNNADVNRILRRQEILSVNMTRGSNALWQKGLTGPMTQFWGYQARITEQLLGKQLTTAEKMRVASVYAGMYGIPVAAGAATFMQIPGASTDDLRQYALENGIDLNSGLASMAVNGIPAEVIRWATSDKNGQGGLLLDIGDRAGPGGLKTLKQLLDENDNTTAIDIAIGASGSITADFVKHFFPNDWDIVSAIGNAPNATLNDYANMFSTISTVNNTTKLYWALTTHQNITRNGTNLGDLSPLSAWVTFTTGLSEQRFKDTYLKLGSMADLKTANDELGKEFVRMMRQAQKLPAGSPERALKIRQARTLIEGLDPTKVKQLTRQVLTDRPLDESVGDNFKQKFPEAN